MQVIVTDLQNYFQYKNRETENNCFKKYHLGSNRLSFSKIKPVAKLSHNRLYEIQDSGFRTQDLGFRFLIMNLES